MKVFKVLLRFVYVFIFLLLFNYIADNLLVLQWLASPILTGESGRSSVTWPLRRDPVLSWALAPPPEAAWAMSKEFGMIASGVGARWLPAALDMGPPLKLLILGDESSFGPGLSLDNTYGGFIKESVEREKIDRTVAVGNAAVPGYDALQMLLLFNKMSVLEPHLAFFCFTGGQVLTPSEDDQVARPIDLNQGMKKEIFYRPGLTQAIYLGLGRIMGSREVSSIKWSVSKDRVHNDDSAEFAEIVERIIKTAEGEHIPLLLATIGLPESHRIILERICRREEIAYLDGDLALLAHHNAPSPQSERRGRTAEKGKAEEAAKIAILDSKAAAKKAKLAEQDPSGRRAFQWWISEHLRPEVAPVFESQQYFDDDLLPTAQSHRVFGRKAAELILEQDLFSWRHRVL